MVKNGNLFKDNVLITSGCSFTAGGNFNNIKFFLKELPQYEKLIKTNIFGHINLDDNNSEFKKLYKKYLWPYRLSELLKSKKVFNLAASGKGIESTLNNLYTCIFSEIDKGTSSDNLMVIYQLPSFLRKETIFKKTNEFVCVLTEMDDSSNEKIEFISNFYDEYFLYRNYINELYKFQKLCNSLKINFLCFSWDYADLKFDFYDSFKQNVDYIKLNKNSNKRHLINYKSIDDILHIDIDKMISEINMINFSNKGLSEYAISIKKVKNFNFELKYPGETNDTHPTIDGCEFIAKTLYKKLINKYI